jgi:hypothetical protein
MKKLLILIGIFVSSHVNAQFIGNLYKDFLKYGTVYGAGDVNNSIQASEQTFFVRTNPDGSIYSIPDVVDMTPRFPFDFRYGIGIRKLARFDYERKPKNFYDGTENQLAFSAPTSAFKGLEYQIHFERERFRGESFTNHRVFLKHTGKYHIAKVETREVGKINLNYKSAELRARLPIGKELSISVGAIARGHERAYGYNPIEIWLNETNENGDAINPWYTLGYDNGYTDHYTTYTDTDGSVTNDWIWKDSIGDIVAYTDLDFRERIYPSLMNMYNSEQWDLLDPWIEVAPIVGFDCYHYKDNFWLHAYVNYILPYHSYVAGEEEFSYLNRNNWGKGGLRQDSKLEQWHDYSAGLNFGWKVGESLGVFFEGEYSKMWDSEIFQTTFGLNYTLK